MRAVPYAGVWSEQQTENDLSISAQLEAFRKYAAEIRWVIRREYGDGAERSRTANRSAFQEMITTAKQKSKPFDVTLV